MSSTQQLVTSFPWAPAFSIALLGRRPALEPFSHISRITMDTIVQWHWQVAAVSQEQLQSRIHEMPSEQ